MGKGWKSNLGLQDNTWCVCVGYCQNHKQEAPLTCSTSFQLLMLARFMGTVLLAWLCLTNAVSAMWSSSPTLGIPPDKIIIQNNTCVPMFTAALFAIAKAWRQPKCPSADEWVKKMSFYWSPRKAFLSLIAILWNSAFKLVYLSFSSLPFE